MLEKPKDVIVLSYGLGEFNLSWKASNQRPYNFTVYWCKTVKPRPSKCDGPLEWLHTTRTKHMLRLPDKDTGYQFAVSANDDGYTSGMSWASCIVYYKGGKLIRFMSFLGKICKFCYNTRLIVCKILFLYIMVFAEGIS